MIKIYFRVERELANGFVSFTDVASLPEAMTLIDIFVDQWHKTRLVVMLTEPAEEGEKFGKCKSITIHEWK